MHVEAHVLRVRELPRPDEGLLRARVDALQGDGGSHPVQIAVLPHEGPRVLEGVALLRGELLVQDDPREDAADPGVRHRPGHLVLPVEMVQEGGGP